MKQDEIIEMAREAGFTINELHCSPPIISFIGHEEEMEAFAKLVAAKKQEDIIQIIKETPFSNWFQADVIEAIRARGQA
jgi:hypothetical protein